MGPVLLDQKHSETGVGPWVDCCSLPTSSRPYQEEYWSNMRCYFRRQDFSKTG